MGSGATTFHPTAEIYESELVSILFRPWAGRLLDLAKPVTGERVLDVACGTGIVARLAAPRVGPGGRVVGVDINPSMLEIARREASERPEQGPNGGGPAIEWHEADAETLPFEDAGFDVVLCQHGLQYVDDKVAALSEMRRVLSPRGRVALTVWRGSDLNPGLDSFGEALARHLPAEVVGHMDAPFSFGDPEELRTALHTAGFSEASIRLEVGGARYRSPKHMIEALGGAFAPLAAALAELDEQAYAALITDLTEALGPTVDDEGVLDPMCGTIAIARP